MHGRELLCSYSYIDRAIAILIGQDILRYLAILIITSS